MESNIDPESQDAKDARDAQDTQDTGYQQVTVDVPADRLAEFHAFFGRFLAAAEGRRRGRRGHRRRHGHHAHGRGGRACARGREHAEQSPPAVEPTEL